ncbi:hypothetical protein AVEN_171839-1 [Araneus ventricosus]|uniref:Uncharacterized protein n=1 Tax=Araneus ventricosus TaxID=182803 RepID=A0A4Y2F599_ARAVE|nr:hypothetical protein AVEN_171839-1 [Araneus ventricosus]
MANDKNRPAKKNEGKTAEEVQLREVSFGDSPGHFPSWLGHISRGISLPFTNFLTTPTRERLRNRFPLKDLEESRLKNLPFPPEFPIPNPRICQVPMQSSDGGFYDRKLPLGTCKVPTVLTFRFYDRKLPFGTCKVPTVITFRFYGRKFPFGNTVEPRLTSTSYTE